MFKNYYLLTKPGIIKGNLLTATMGFLLASSGNVSLSLLFETLLGISLVIAASCVINNYIDRDIDKKMERTKNRALVTGTISPRNALIFASTLGIIGFVDLAIYTNLIVCLLGFTATIFYVVIYGYFKRHSIHGTLVGTISGSIPPVAGYCAVADRIDLSAVLLFVIMVFWQMAHFYAIAIYRISDYKDAGIPVLPIIKGIQKTKVEILLFIVGFTLTTIFFSQITHTSKIFGFIYAFIGLAWLGIAIKTYHKIKATIWAKQVFIFSLIVICLFALTLSVSSFLT